MCHCGSDCVTCLTFRDSLVIVTCVLLVIALIASSGGSAVSLTHPVARRFFLECLSLSLTFSHFLLVQFPFLPSNFLYTIPVSSCCNLHDGFESRQPQERQETSATSAPDGADGGPIFPDVSLADCRQFPNALRIAGILHVSDNCLKNILQGLTGWGDLLKGLRSLECLLARPMFRERFVHTCIQDKRGKDSLKYWSVTLKGLRWQSVLEFTMALLPLETTLRHGTNFRLSWSHVPWLCRALSKKSEFSFSFRHL